MCYSSDGENAGEGVPEENLAEREAFHDGTSSSINRQRDKMDFETR